MPPRFSTATAMTSTFRVIQFSTSSFCLAASRLVVGRPNAPTLAKMVEDAGAAAIAVHGRTAEQSYSGQADWDLVSRIAEDLTIPVFGSGDCLDPEQVIARMRSGGIQGRQAWISVTMTIRSGCACGQRTFGRSHSVTTKRKRGSSAKA